MYNSALVCIVQYTYQYTVIQLDFFIFPLMYLKLFLSKAVDYFRHFYGFLLDETVNFENLL
jgi:hypothetical protein